MTLSEIDICSIALTKVGADEIESFDDETVEAEVARRLYQVTLQGLIANHPWHFSTAEADLERLDEPGAFGFARIFALPDDVLRIIAARSASGGSIKYRISADRLFTNSDRTILTYQRQPSPSLYPAFFTQALVARLAAEFCLPLTESNSRAESLQNLATAELRMAKLIDSQQATSAAIEDYPLIAVRSR